MCFLWLYLLVSLFLVLFLWEKHCCTLDSLWLKIKQQNNWGLIHKTVHIIGIRRQQFMLTLTQFFIFKITLNSPVIPPCQPPPGCEYTQQSACRSSIRTLWTKLQIHKKMLKSVLLIFLVWRSSLSRKPEVNTARFTALDDCNWALQMTSCCKVVINKLAVISNIVSENNYEYIWFYLTMLPDRGVMYTSFTPLFIHIACL